MNTPICDFVKKYRHSNPIRLHMPGHKGKNVLGFENYDITEITGADSLFEANGIINQSENNASSLFGTAATLYSTEGSSLSIRAMLELIRQYAVKNGQDPLIFAGRNAHKVFTVTAGILNIDVKWLYPDIDTAYLSAVITPNELEKALKSSNIKPTAVYITSPDYLGNISDIAGLSKICKKHGVLLAVDNAHGSYLKFLSDSLHPIDLGANICCDSAHKTLPVLTGGAYLHISENVPKEFISNAKSAMAMFGSTSPSYLILQSLDMANKYLSNGYREKLASFVKKLNALKEELTNFGYTLVDTEPLKITIKTKVYGYTGKDFAEILKKQNIFCEFYDPDFVVMMFNEQIKPSELKHIKNALLGIPVKNEIITGPPEIFKAKKVTDIHSALFGENEDLAVSQSQDRVLSTVNVSCPPAVPILVCGEKITENAVSLFEYYGIKTIKVLK